MVSSLGPGTEESGHSQEMFNNGTNPIGLDESRAVRQRGTAGTHGTTNYKAGVLPTIKTRKA